MKPRGQTGQIEQPCALGCGMVHIADRPEKPHRWTDLGFDESGEHLGFACPRHDIRKRWEVWDSSRNPALEAAGYEEAQRLEAVAVRAMRSEERDRLARERLEARAVKREKMRAKLEAQRERGREAAEKHGLELDAAAERARLAVRIRQRFAGAVAKSGVVTFVAERWPDKSVAEQQALVVEVLSGGGS